MKTIGAFALIAVCFFSGCSSEETKEAPKTMATPAPAPVSTETKPAMNSPMAINPLDDPNSLLSKRSTYYDFDKSIIKDEYKPLIQAHGEYLAGHPNAKVRIEGNCDERGSREYNLALGQRRADGVKAAMKLVGAKDGQIDTVSYGKEKPKAEGHNEAAWAQNRRSDIVYLTTE